MLGATGLIPWRWSSEARGIRWMSLGRQTLNQQLMLQAVHTMVAQTSECEKLDSFNLDLQLQLEPWPPSDMLQFNPFWCHFDVVFVTLSSICDKATAYNCIGRVYCLHSVFGEFSVQAPPRDPPLEAKAFCTCFKYTVIPYGQFAVFMGLSWQVMNSTWSFPIFENSTF